MSKTEYAYTTGTVGTAIGIGISIFAFGTALAMLIAAPLGALGIEVEVPDEDPTQKYETGLPQNEVIY